MSAQEITDLVAVLEDERLNVNARTAAVAALLSTQSDRGAAAAAAVAATHERGSFASNYLALLPTIGSSSGRSSGSAWKPVAHDSGTPAT